MDQNNQQPTPVNLAPPQPSSYPNNAVNPGKTLGIVSIVLGVIALWIVGLPLAIVSVVKSSKAHASKTLGIVGIVLNTLSLLMTVILVPIVLVATATVQERTKDDASITFANEVVNKAEVYYNEKTFYPASVTDFSTVDLAKLTSTEYTVINTAPTNYKEVQYEMCTDGRAVVSYYVTTEKTVRSVSSDGSEDGC